MPPACALLVVSPALQQGAQAAIVPSPVSSTATEIRMHGLSCALPRLTVSLDTLLRESNP